MEQMVFEKLHHFLYFVFVFVTLYHYFLVLFLIIHCVSVYTYVGFVICMDMLLYKKKKAFKILKQKIFYCWLVSCLSHSLSLSTVHTHFPPHTTTISPPQPLLFHRRKTKHIISNILYIQHIQISFLFCHLLISCNKLLILLLYFYYFLFRFSFVPTCACVVLSFCRKLYYPKIKDLWASA